MSIDYTIYLSLSIKLSVILSIITTIATMIKWFIDESVEFGLDLFIHIFLSFLDGIRLFIFSLLIYWPLFYVLLNTFFQPNLTISVFQTEISNGTIALRFTTLWLTIKAMITSKNNNDPIGYIEKKKYKRLTEKISAEDVMQFIVNQYFVFVVVVNILWYFTINNVQTTIITILNYTLFFIIDDWNIIADNFIATKGRMMITHTLRITIANLMILILGSFIIIKSDFNYKFVLLWIFITLFTHIFILTYRKLFK